jgi:hypothetical protein
MLCTLCMYASSEVPVGGRILSRLAAVVWDVGVRVSRRGLWSPIGAELEWAHVIVFVVFFERYWICSVAVKHTARRTAVAEVAGVAIAVPSKRVESVRCNCNRSPGIAWRLGSSI